MNTNNYQNEINEEMTEVKISKRKIYLTGMACAIGCAVLWGLLPIYWRALRPIDSFVIIFYRIILVAIVTSIAALKIYGVQGILKPLKQKGLGITFFLAGLLITINWSIYIWAVNANHVIQTCIGYYIEPLMVCVFGIMFFKEKLNKYKLTALALAMAGVVYMLICYKEPPIIALSLAISFSTYAAIKKKYQLESVLALFYETIFLSPVAVIMVVYYEVTGQGAFAIATNSQLLLLSLAGIVTAIPLILFAMAANRITLVSLGITEYISPSITLLIGIFIFKESFDVIQFTAFAIIWVGLAIFTFGEAMESKRERNGE